MSKCVTQTFIFPDEMSYNFHNNNIFPVKMSYNFSTFKSQNNHISNEYYQPINKPSVHFS